MAEREARLREEPSDAEVLLDAYIRDFRTRGVKESKLVEWYGKEAVDRALEFHGKYMARLAKEGKERRAHIAQVMGEDYLPQKRKEHAEELARKYADESARENEDGVQESGNHSEGQPRTEDGRFGSTGGGHHDDEHDHPDYDAHPPNDIHKDVDHARPFEYDGFEWHPPKEEKNIRDHGVSFDEASEAVNNAQSNRYSKLKGEARWIVKGSTSSGRMLNVVVTKRGNVCRIISASRVP